MVYAVLVETGLNKAEIGKLIMAATFVTDLGTVLALTLLFVRPTPWLLAFIGVSAAAIFLMPRLESWFFGRYGNRVIEPEIKGAFAVLLTLMLFGELAKSHAVLPAFLLGLAVARVFHKHPQLQSFQVVAFASLTEGALEPWGLGKLHAVGHGGACKRGGFCLAPLGES